MTRELPAAAHTARVLHLALIMACVTIGVTFTVVTSMGLLRPAGFPPVLQWLAGPAVVGVLAVRAVLHRRLNRLAGVPGWTPERLAAVVAIWAVEEGGYVLGTVLWALSGGPALLLLAGAAFALLLWDRPGRLVGT